MAVFHPSAPAEDGVTQVFADPVGKGLASVAEALAGKPQGRFLVGPSGEKVVYLVGGSGALCVYATHAEPGQVGHAVRCEACNGEDAWPTAGRWLCWRCD